MTQDNSIDAVEVKSEYYKSGALSSETPFVNGVANGIAKIYYESGALWVETPYVNGERHGISRDYDRDNSNICCLTLYNMDREVAIVVSNI